jgi:hypothetical protein
MVHFFWTSNALQGGGGTGIPHVGSGGGGVRVPKKKSSTLQIGDVIASKKGNPKTLLSARSLREACGRLRTQLRILSALSVSLTVDEVVVVVECQLKFYFFSTFFGLGISTMVKTKQPE